MRHKTPLRLWSAMCAWLMSSAALLGCGRTTGDACREFVTQYEALSCTVGVPVDVDCWMYDHYPCDGTPFFECAMESQSCVDGALKDGLMACAYLAVCPS